MSTPHNTRAETTPQRAVATYHSYEEAERAVDYLSDNEFPVQRTVIVGRGLDMVEQITGRYTYWSAAGKGAANGAVVGALFGWLFGLFGWVAPLIADLLLCAVRCRHRRGAGCSARHREARRHRRQA
ncbi:hypothetical protein FHU38_004116 [Saccharomonospora amisosensis]|uniref:General stress protein 17M-like domain-containing protein n=1 Tax=Saccharomonospora amisosensis TaxID=1128677 RepID=A0A7X5UT71_9PSEU|nr:general stress protein [Saccharomonospora amisosensis]NIJ13772.1 hypothetical protein [Saccharomonospora amisosensis]